MELEFSNEATKKNDTSAERQVPLSEIIRYAEYAINQPEIRMLIENMISKSLQNDYRDDEEMESINVRLAMIAKQYILERDQPWNYMFAMTQAYTLVRAVLENKANSIESPEALELLKDSRYIKHPEEKIKWQTRFLLTLVDLTASLL